MDDSQLIRTRTPEFRAFHDRVKVATRLSAKLSSHCMDEAEAIQVAFEELIGKPVGDAFTLIPPFYTDYGLNVSVGRPCSSATVRVHGPRSHRHRRPGHGRPQGQPRYGRSSR